MVNNELEYIICSAIYYNDEVKREHQPMNIDYGIVICGRRHHNCFIILKEIFKDNYKKYLMIQGFITSKDRFVNREEANKIAFDSGQVKYFTTKLISEDLY